MSENKGTEREYTEVKAWTVDERGRTAALER